MDRRVRSVSSRLSARERVSSYLHEDDALFVAPLCELVARSLAASLNGTCECQCELRLNFAQLLCFLLLLLLSFLFSPLARGSKEASASRDVKWLDSRSPLQRQCPRQARGASDRPIDDARAHRPEQAALYSSRRQ